MTVNGTVENTPALEYAPPASRRRGGVAWAATGLALALAQLVVVGAGYLFGWQCVSRTGGRTSMVRGWPHFAFAAIGVVPCAVGMARGSVKFGAVGLSAAVLALVAAVVLGAVSWGR